MLWLRCKLLITTVPRDLVLHKSRSSAAFTPAWTRQLRAASGQGPWTGSPGSWVEFWIACEPSDSHHPLYIICNCVIFSDPTKINDKKRRIIYTYSSQKVKRMSLKNVRMKNTFHSHTQKFLLVSSSRLSIHGFIKFWNVSFPDLWLMQVLSSTLH